MTQGLLKLTVATVVLSLVAGCGWTNRMMGKERRTDSSITAAVKQELVRDEAANAGRINVDTRNGIVYLRGEVPTIDDKTRAGRIARDVSGVRDVQNELHVTTAAMAPTRTEPAMTRTGMAHPVWAAADNPGCVLIPRTPVELMVYDDPYPTGIPHVTTPTRTAGDLGRQATRSDINNDPTLARAVRERLVEEHIADARDLHVEADRERVYLDGTVDSLEKKREAGEIAQRMTGASIIDNHLRVQSAGKSSETDVRRVSETTPLRGDPIWTGKLIPGHRYELRSHHGLIRYDYRVTPNDRFHGDVGAWCNRGHSVIVP